MFSSLTGPIALAVGAGLAFAESGLGAGMVVPGETGVLALAATVGRGPLLVGLLLAVALGACLGDHVGYLLGRRYGARMRASRVVTRMGQEHWDRATDVVRRRGPAAVFWTRLVPIVRTLTPAAAGVSGVGYRRFLPASLAGSLLWASVYVGAGSIAAATFEAVGAVAGRGTWMVLGSLLAASGVVLVARRIPRPTYAPTLRAGAPTGGRQWSRTLAGAP